MSVLQVETKLPWDEVLRAIEQLSSEDLDRFADQVTAARARRKAPALSARETELLLRINEGIPLEVQARYAALIRKRRERTLTSPEHAEILRLGDEVEAIEARRIEALSELAQIRNTTVADVMAHLGLKAPEVA